VCALSAIASLLRSSLHAAVPSTQDIRVPGTCADMLGMLCKQDHCVGGARNMQSCRCTVTHQSPQQSTTKTAYFSLFV
jgi:hypothetical protein